MEDKEYFTREEFVNMVEAYNKAEKERQELEVENAELKAYMDVNEDFKTAWEELKAENERLKEELATYGATGVCEVCSDKANKLADKYLGCLQESQGVIENQYMDIILNMYR